MLVCKKWNTCEDVGMADPNALVAGGYVEQQYLPDKLKDRIYYVPSDYGFEKKVKEIRRDKGKLK